MFRVQCPSCQRLIKLKDEYFGRKVSCKCGKVLRLPKDNGAQELGDFIEFSCTKCKQKLKAKLDIAGKNTRCSRCGERNQVPIPVNALSDVETVPVEAEVVAAPFEDLLPDFEDPVDLFESSQPLPATSAYQNPAYQNPYSAPARTAPKKKKRYSSNQSDVQQVIKGQKLLIYALLGYLSIVFFGLAIGILIPLLGELEETTVSLLMLLFNTICGLIGLASLTTAVMGMSQMSRVVMGDWWFFVIPLMLIPCFAGLIILIVNARATGYLRGKGIKIGFLGAK